MDVSVMKDWLGLIALLISIGTSVVLFVGSGSKKNAEKIEKQQSQLNDHDRRIQNLEGELGHLPKATALHELELNMEKLNAQIAVLTESLKPIRANAELINDLLREQVKK